MKNEIVGNVPLPSDWAKELKKSTKPQSTATSTNSKSTSSNSNANSKVDNNSLSDFPQRLASLKKNSPKTLENALQITRKNYK
jgi:hypothetical protein